MRLTPIADATTDELRDLYAAVFGEPPWSFDAAQVDRWAARFDQERTAQGFDGVVARRGTSPLGMAYGLPTPDPWPDDRGYPRVAAAVDTDRLAGAFEIQVLGMAPGEREAGMGSALLDALAATRSKVWLVTRSDAEPAIRLYVRAGFEELVREGDLVALGRGV